MPIRFEDGVALFDGPCTVEEEVPLAEWLERTEFPRVDLGPCTALHTALLQVLLTARPALAAEPENAFLRAWVAPLLR